MLWLLVGVCGGCALASYPVEIRIHRITRSKQPPELRNAKSSARTLAAVYLANVATPTERYRLLLLPGLDGTGRLFAPILPFLESHFDCRTIEYPTDTNLRLSDLASTALLEMGDLSS